MSSTNEAFTVGKQPCQDFKPEQDGNGLATWDNRHECYCGCGKTTSFCLTCYKDHHEDGYETCNPPDRLDDIPF